MKVTKEQAAVQFLGKYGATISAALGLYSEEMGKASAAAQAQYEFLRSVPAAREANDAPSDPEGGTIKIQPTTRGYGQSAGLFLEASQKADEAQTALTDYEEAYE